MAQGPEWSDGDTGGRIEGNVQFALCSDCYDYIFELDPKVAKVWVKLCTAYIGSRMAIGFKKKNDYRLRILEEEGFVISTEDEEYTIYRPLGYGIDKGMETFCICEECDDEEEWE